MQATMYGKYHITNAQSFYSAADAWTLSPSRGRARRPRPSPTTLTTNAQGQEVSTGQLVRMAPIYQVLKVPGQTQQSFSLLDAFVPVSSAEPDPDPVGVHDRRIGPRPLRPAERCSSHRGTSRSNGPAIVAAKIDATPAVSQEISLLNQNGSSVLLGNVLMIPVADSLLYIQPLYVRVVAERLPRAAAGHRRLREPAGRHREHAGGRPRPSSPRRCPTTPAGELDRRHCRPRSEALLAQAQAAYTQSQTDLKAGNLGAYQTDINALEQNLQEVQPLTGGHRRPRPPRPPPRPPEPAGRRPHR